MSKKKLTTCSEERLAQLFEYSQYVQQDDFETPIVKQIEAVRLHEGLNVEDFCKIMGLSKSNYYHICSQTRGLTFSFFIRFCRIFGYDLSTFSGESYLDSQDSIFRELALFLGRLSPETIQQIQRDIQESAEPENNKRRADVLLPALVEAVQAPDFRPLTFFGDDKQDKENQ